MASIETPGSSQSPSFSIRGGSGTTHHHHNNFLRSFSTKESSFADAPCTSPRLSSTSLNNQGFLHNSQPSTPRLSFTSSPTKLDDDLHTTYTCISSVLKKDGQILSIASSNGLVYTGSQSNVIRLWKLPEFTECGQLKTKATVVLALQISNDRVYAAYADCKIRVWRRTWEGVTKHVRLATIPKTGSYVRSYIAGKDKTVPLV